MSSSKRYTGSDALDDVLIGAQGIAKTAKIAADFIPIPGIEKGAQILVFLKCYPLITFHRQILPHSGISSKVYTA